MDYANLCTQILDISTMVRFAAVYHMSGEKMFGGYKEGKYPLTNTTIDFQQSILRGILLRHAHITLEEYFGKEKYTVIEFEKAKAFIFPLENDLLLLASMEPGGDHRLFVDRIIFLLKN